MIIAPPSRRGNGAYEWLNDHEILDAPPWLIEKARAVSAKGRSSGNGGAPSADPEAPVEMIVAALSVLSNPPDASVGRRVNFRRWNVIGMSAHRGSGGDAVVLAAFDAFSRKNTEKYDADYVLQKWRGYRKSPITEITVASLFDLASEESPGWRALCDPDVVARHYAERDRRAEEILREAARNDDQMMAEIAKELAAREAAAAGNDAVHSAHVPSSPTNIDAAQSYTDTGAACAGNTNTPGAINGNAGAVANPDIIGAAQASEAAKSEGACASNCNTNTAGVVDGSANPDTAAAKTDTASASTDGASTNGNATAGANSKPASTAPSAAKPSSKSSGRPDSKPRGRPMVALPLTLAEVAGSGHVKERLVAEVNERVALVLVGNKAAVMLFEPDGKTFRLISIEAFQVWYANKGANSDEGWIPTAKLWLTARNRREFEGIEFDPAPAGGRPGYYNLWQGFAVEPRPGDCGKFLAHIRDNIAQGNPLLYNWVIGFFAQIVQQPAVKLGTALAIRGEPGVGKTKVGEVFGSLLKPHYKLVADPRFVTGKFNAHMTSLLLLHADEAFWAGDRRSEGKLKDLVTGSEHLIEFKGVDAISVRNHMRLFVTGNSDWLVPAAFRERRWAVIDAGNAHIQDHAYFAAIDYEMDHGGREALLHHLKTFDLKIVNLREIPQTKALLEQKFQSASAEEKFWLDTLRNGKLPGASETTPNACRKSKLYDAYIGHARRTGVSHRSIETKVGMFLSDHVPGLISDQKVTYAFYNENDDKETKQAWAFKFPALADCRKAFADKIKQAVDWGTDVADWQADELVDIEPRPGGRERGF
jgi:hypothetical protein